MLKHWDSFSAELQEHMIELRKGSIILFSLKMLVL